MMNGAAIKWGPKQEGSWQREATLFCTFAEARSASHDARLRISRQGGTVLYSRLLQGTPLLRDVAIAAISWLRVISGKVLEFVCGEAVIRSIPV